MWPPVRPPAAIAIATGHSTMPLKTNIMAAKPLMHVAPQFFSPFILWMLVRPIRPSVASIRMPMPAPK